MKTEMELKLESDTGLFWSVVGKVFHRSELDLPLVLDRLLSNLNVQKDDSILDAACGTGFPAIELFRMGYKNLQCSDASSATIEKLKQSLEKENLGIPMKIAKWSELDSMFVNQKVVLVLGSSISYIISWDKPNQLIDSAEAFSELEKSFKSIYGILKNNGLVIIGISKNSDITEPINIQLGSTTLKGIELKITWDITPLLDQRLRKFDSIIESEEFEKPLIITRYGLRIAQGEMADLLTKIGFKKIEIHDLSQSHYDNYIIAYK